MAFADAIKQNLTQLAEAPKPQQEELETIARTAATGKARAGVAPKASAIGEQRAQQQFKTQAQQQSLAGQQEATKQQQQGEAQKQAAEMQRQQLGQKRELAIKEMDQQGQMQLDKVSATVNRQIDAIAQQKGIQGDQLLTKLAQNSEQLASSGRVSDLEQAAFLHSLRNKEYLAELARAGSIQQLETELGQKEAIREIVNGQSSIALQHSLGINEEILADKLATQDFVAGLDLEDALAMAQASIDSANAKAVAEGVGTVVGAGASVLAGYKPGKSAPKRDIGSETRTTSASAPTAMSMTHGGLD